ncbi:MAG: hypothetical protein U0T74_03330 [Chitinophagales bacterium]
MEKTTTAFFFAFLLFAFISSCDKDGKSVSNISSYNSTRSHNMGQNCMNCHKQGGEGEGWFTAAGTVYKPNLSTTNPNNTIYLYTGPNGTGTLKATIEGDAKGNFHTTESIDFGSGLYPCVKNSANDIQYMSSSITQGACNSCHGVSEDKIWNN